MKLLNRSAFVLRPKDPYIQWASAIDGEPPESLSDLRDHVSVYLVPEEPTGTEETPPLSEYFAEIFDSELEAWSLDLDMWPQSRTLEMFQDWFEVYAESVIVDLGEGDIVIDDL